GAYRRGAHPGLCRPRRGRDADPVRARRAVQLDGLHRRGRGDGVLPRVRQGHRHVDADHGVLLHGLRALHRQHVPVPERTDARRAVLLRRLPGLEREPDRGRQPGRWPDLRRPDDLRHPRPHRRRRRPCPACAGPVAGRGCRERLSAAGHGQSDDDIARPLCCPGWRRLPARGNGADRGRSADRPGDRGAAAGAPGRDVPAVAAGKRECAGPRSPACAGHHLLERMGWRRPAWLWRAARAGSGPRRGQVDAHRGARASPRRGGGAAVAGGRRGAPSRLPAAQPGDRQPARLCAGTRAVRACRLPSLRSVRGLRRGPLFHVHDPGPAGAKRGSTMKKPRLVVVGNGMAGIRTLEELLKLVPGMYDITVFGAEPHPNYNRILLSPVLAGEQDFDDIVLNPLSWYEDNGIRLHLGRQVTRIDRVHRRAIAADGRQAEYCRLRLATGAVLVILPVPGKDLRGVIGYRDIHDTQAMIDAARVKRHAVVIGGGLLGLEAANGLMLRGMDVTVVHLAGWLLERQLDPVAGALLETSLVERGLKFRLNTSTSELVGNAAGEVAAVRFSDGSEIPADLVVMAAGIRPNTTLAQEAGIHCNRGIVVNDSLQTF